MPAALQLVVFLCYLIPLHEPPLLALQIGPGKNFGRAVGRGQDLYLAAPAQVKRQGYADVRCRAAALAASFLLQMRVHSTQMACCEDNQGAAAAIRRA
jgi:hypothetical protein